MTSRHWSLLGGAAEDQVALVLQQDDENGLSVAWFGDWQGPQPGALPPQRRQRWGARLDAGPGWLIGAGYGGGYPAAPALELRRPDGRWTFLPEAVDVRPMDADSLEVTLTDGRVGVRLDVRFRLVVETGVLEVDTCISNLEAADLVVTWCASAHLPLPFWADHLLDHAGDWCAEFRRELRPLGEAGLLREVREGRSSHARPPMLAFSEGAPLPDRGRVLGMQLAWSGNHRSRVDRLPHGCDMVQLGVLPLADELLVAPSSCWQAPTAHVAVSTRGLDGLSERFARHCRARVLPKQGQRWPRPVHLNTWEAVYFDHGMQRLEALVDAAAALGVERFVLDDGWFRGRTDDRRALGDWIPDPERYPHGLAPLIERVHDRGMGFGLWVEPEMISEDSELFRQHPGWARGLAGRAPLLGRQQRVLDLTRPEVLAHVFETLDGLLRRHTIDYLKWDHNRTLTEAAADGGPGHVGQTKGLYALLDRLRAAHPEVEIESCASGGGRLDWGMLERCHRVWSSDSNDPVLRARIMVGAGLFLPPEVLGVHVGPECAHTTGRSTSLDFRAAVALLGHFGLELDLLALSDADRVRLAAHVARYKRVRDLLHAGRHATPVFDADHIVRVVTAKDRRSALLIVLRLDDRAPGRPLQFRCVGLDPSCDYRLRLAEPLPDPDLRPIGLVGGKDFASAGAVVSGAWLAHAGLRLQLPAPQSAAVFELEAC